MIKKGMVFKNNQSQTLLVKVSNIMYHGYFWNNPIVSYREVHTDLLIWKDGSFDIDFEYTKGSQTRYLSHEEFERDFIPFEIDEETALRIREGIYG